MLVWRVIPLLLLLLLLLLSPLVHAQDSSCEYRFFASGETNIEEFLHCLDEQKQVIASNDVVTALARHVPSPTPQCPPYAGELPSGPTLPVLGSPDLRQRIEFHEMPRRVFRTPKSEEDVAPLAPELGACEMCQLLVLFTRNAQIALSTWDVCGAEERSMMCERTNFLVHGDAMGSRVTSTLLHHADRHIATCQRILAEGCRPEVAQLFRDTISSTALCYARDAQSHAIQPPTRCSPGVVCQTLGHCVTSEVA